jgi:hypothetical protein
MCAGLAIEVTARLGWQAPPLNNLMPGRIYAQVNERLSRFQIGRETIGLHIERERIQEVLLRAKHMRLEVFL